MSVERYQHLKTTLEELPLITTELERQKEWLKTRIQDQRIELQRFENKLEAKIAKVEAQFIKEEQIFTDEKKKISSTIQRCEKQIKSAKNTIDEREKSVQKILERRPISDLEIEKLEASLKKLENEKFDGKSVEGYLNQMVEKNLSVNLSQNEIRILTKQSTHGNEIFIDTSNDTLAWFMSIVGAVLSVYFAYGEEAFLGYICVYGVGFFIAFVAISYLISTLSLRFNQRKNFKIQSHQMNLRKEKARIREEVVREKKNDIKLWNDKKEQIYDAKSQMQALKDHESEITRQRRIMDGLTQKLNDSKISLGNDSSEHRRKEILTKRKQELAAELEHKKSEILERHKEEIEQHQKSISISETRIKDMWTSIKDLIPYSEIIEDL